MFTIAVLASSGGTPRDTRSDSTTSGIRMELPFRFVCRAARLLRGTPACNAPAAALSSSSVTFRSAGSTCDISVSIAWSVSEHLHDKTGCRTVFATHYHELNELEAALPGIKNYHVTNKEIGNKIIFLRKLAPGGSTHSFGIHVARMAGMPPELVERAKEVLAQLEEKHADKPVQQSLKQLGGPKMQLSIFDAHSQTFEEIRNMLNGIDINRLTPVEALLKLNEIKGMLK